ncbi:helix-turn-helix domain-containing protein [Nonomuraea sp. NPDC050643]|uniref:helix-turn-helix domain-containing protein n=1 Tax=Nonomuraea sp. NPDC050643 TaxID=3155660 RepID=UPI0033F917A7
MPHDAKLLSGDPVTELTTGLRALRAEAGLTQRRVAALANYSAGAISMATSGTRLPSWPVTEAYVTACGGDPLAWRQRWEAADRYARQGALPGAGERPASAARSKGAADGPAPLHPSDVRSVADLLEAMVALRVSTGNRSLRELSDRAQALGASLPTSTLCDALNREHRPPSLELLTAFLLACGVTKERDLAPWKEAWWRIKDTDVPRGKAVAEVPVMEAPAVPAAPTARRGGSKRAVLTYAGLMVPTSLLALLAGGAAPSAVSLLQMTVVMLAVGVSALRARRDSAGAARAMVAASPNRLGRAAFTLAEAVSAQVREETEARLLFAPAPLRISWRRTDDHGLLGTFATEDAPRGELDFVSAASFQQSQGRRIVVLGEGGAGKTSLLLMLTRELLDTAGPRDPVPVILRLNSWNPGKEPFKAWLQRRLRHEFPCLADAKLFGAHAARDLVRAGRVLPLLDGLDELPPGHRTRAIERINRSLGPSDSLIVTCRTKEYTETLLPTRKGIAGAGLIYPESVNSLDVITYLEKAVPPRRAHQWAPVMDELLYSGSVLAKAFSRPLEVFMARTIYSAGHEDPADLTGCGDEAVLRAFLLDGIVPAVLAAPPGRPGRRAPHLAARLLRALIIAGGGEFGRWERHGTSPVRRLSNGLAGIFLSRPWQARAWLDDAVRHGLLRRTPGGYDLRCPAIRDGLVRTRRRSPH